MKKFLPFSPHIINWGSIGILPMNGIPSCLAIASPPPVENMFVHSYFEIAVMLPKLRKSYFRNTNLTMRAFIPTHILYNTNDFEINLQNISVSA